MEKFTNIAGGPFQPYVSKQIDIRKKFISESHNNRTNNHLLYQNNRNSWIRLTSSVDIISSHPIAKKYNLSGDKLAKKYILQGGTVEKRGDEIINRGGLGNNGSYNLLPNKPLGFKPMPGITSIDISSAGKLGTLQYANIKFICHDLEQLELFEALYMKLGFSMVLEWGHTFYLDNDNTSTLQKPIPLDVFSYFSKEEIIKSIQKKRVQHSGNYDAMLGTVSNFGWEIQNNGSYICDIKMVGVGDVLESLKINQAITPNTQYITSDQKSLFESDLSGINEEDRLKLSSLVGDRDLSLLNRALFDISQYIMHLPSFKGVKTMGTLDKGYRDILNKIFSSSPYKFLQFDDSGNATGDDIVLKGNHYSLLSGLSTEGLNKTEIPKIKGTLFNVFKIHYKINDNSPDTNPNGLQPQVYISLGNLLCIMTSTGMIYDSNTSDGGNPYIYADFNDFLNYCSTFKGQVSLDPTICIIPRNQNSLEDPFNLGVIEDRLFDTINGNTVTKTNNSSTGMYMGGSMAGSISVPIVEETTIEVTKAIGVKNSYLNTDNNSVRARLMHILVNTNYITDTLSKLRDKDEKGNVSYSDFLNEILSGISKALGGFNEFRILVDDTSKSFRIIDDNKITTPQESDDLNQYTELPLFGKDSIVYDYNFKSKISPKMASMVTIAAQAEPSVLGDDAFAISNLSRGLEDRLMRYKRTSEEVKLNDTTPVSNIPTESLISLKTHLKNILTGNSYYFDLNTDLIESSYNTYKEILAKYRIQEDSTNKGTVLIPLDFNLTMDGMSGIIPNSAFTIPTNLLPSTYLTKDGKSKIAFILHTINQDFSNNKWKTKLTGQTINIRFDKEDEKEYIPKIVELNAFGTPTNIYQYPTFVPNQSCTKRASQLFSKPGINAYIELLKKEANELGLSSPQAVASLIAISGGETGIFPKSEAHVYKSIKTIQQSFPNMSLSQMNRLLVKGISKKDAFQIIYGEYKPKRIGNRNISDGGKYYGRGYIQLTGYENYKRYARLSGVDILSNPELVNDPKIGAKISAIYMNDRVKTDQYSNNYFNDALKSVGNQVRDSYIKKTEYYNCYLTKPQ